VAQKRKRYKKREGILGEIHPKKNRLKFSVNSRKKHRGKVQKRWGGSRKEPAGKIKRKKVNKKDCRGWENEAVRKKRCLTR